MLCLLFSLVVIVQFYYHLISPKKILVDTQKILFMFPLFGLAFVLHCLSPCNRKHCEQCFLSQCGQLAPPAPCRPATQEQKIPSHQRLQGHTRSRRHHCSIRRRCSTSVGISHSQTFPNSLRGSGCVAHHTGETHDARPSPDVGGRTCVLTVLSTFLPSLPFPSLYLSLSLPRYCPLAIVSRKADQ